MSQNPHWTPEVKAAFIDALAASGEVLAAVESVGLSPQSAYRHRALDPEFARAWDSARVMAREVVVEELRSRALHGWDENVYFRGELVGTRKRHDNRLLLALLARLDRLAGDAGDATARRARDHFGRLVETLGSGAPTDDCYPLSIAEEVKQAMTDHELRNLRLHYTTKLEYLKLEEEMVARERARRAGAEWLDDEDEDDDEEDEHLHPLLRRPPRPAPGNATDSVAADAGVADDCTTPAPAPAPAPASAEVDSVDPQPGVSAARGHHPVSPLPSEAAPAGAPQVAAAPPDDWPSDDDRPPEGDRHDADEDAEPLSCRADPAWPRGPSIRALGDEPIGWAPRHAQADADRTALQCITRA